MRSGGRPRTELPKLGHPTGKDVVAGFVTGLFSVPEGMAYAGIGGSTPCWDSTRGWRRPWSALYSPEQS